MYVAVAVVVVVAFAAFLHKPSKNLTLHLEQVHPDTFRICAAFGAEEFDVVIDRISFLVDGKRAVARVKSSPDALGIFKVEPPTGSWRLQVKCQVRRVKKGSANIAWFLKTWRHSHCSTGELWDMSKSVLNDQVLVLDNPRQ